MMDNKKGGIGLIIFFSVLFGVLIVGFIATIGWTVIDLASDTITPIMDDLGMVGETNLSQVSEYTFGKTDIIVQSFNWIIAIMFLLSLVFSIVFVFVSGYQPHPVFIGFFFVLMILLIFGSVIMSNMYQDIYNGDDEIGSRLKEQKISSYLILNSPFIFTLIAAIGGIIMFTRQSNAEGGGSFGI